jgi:tetratricopeptide (TPR) repeat protein
MPPYDNLEFEDLLLEADELIRQNKISDAIHLLEGIIAEAPDFGKAYNHLGWIYETKLKDFESAEKMYRQCLAYHPQYPPVYLNLAIVLSTLGKFSELEELLRKGLEVPGVDKAAIYNELGIMFELKLAFALALDHYRQAIAHSLNDTNVELYMKSMERCRNKQQILPAGS